MSIKEYCLVKPSARNSINLENYQKIIIKAYTMVNPNLEVRVQCKSYKVLGDLTRGQAIKAGRIIAKSSLGRYAVKYPINSKHPSTVQIFRGKRIK